MSSNYNAITNQYELTGPLNMPNVPANSLLAINGGKNITGIQLADGQIAIGKTNSSAIAANLNSGGNAIAITNGPNSIIIDVPVTASPTLAGATITGLAPSSFVTTNASSKLTTTTLAVNNHVVSADTSGNLQNTTISYTGANGNTSTVTFSGNTLSFAFSNQQDVSTGSNFTVATLAINSTSSFALYCNGGGNFKSINMYFLTPSTLLSLDASGNVQNTTLAATSNNGNTSTLSFVGNTLTLNASNQQDVSSSGAPSFSRINLGPSLTPINRMLGIDVSGNVVSMPALTNGQLYIGSTGAIPAAGTLTSTGGTVTFTFTAGGINIETSAGITSVTNNNGTNFSLAAGVLTCDMKQNLGTTGTPTFGDITDNGLFASTLVANNASKKLVSSTITNSNGCNFSVNASGNLTASMTQGLGIFDSPTFSNVTGTSTVTTGVINVKSSDGLGTHFSNVGSNSSNVSDQWFLPSVGGATVNFAYPSTTTNAGTVSGIWSSSQTCNISVAQVGSNVSITVKSFVNVASSAAGVLSTITHSFTLPANYRPAVTLDLPFWCINNNTNFVGFMTITSAGVITWTIPGGGSWSNNTLCGFRTGAVSYSVL